MGQAVEAAIELGLERVEAGAQGEHKIQRGYLPSMTYSSHYIRDPSFSAAISQYLQREAMQVPPPFDDCPSSTNTDIWLLSVTRDASRVHSLSLSSWKLIPTSPHPPPLRLPAARAVPRYDITVGGPWASCHVPPLYRRIYC